MINNIVFAGTPEISSKLLDALIEHGFNVCACYTQPDRPKGRNLKLEYSPVKKVALKHNIPVFQPEKLQDYEVIVELEKLQPDLMIVFAYGLILPKKILTIPTLGCVNVHLSLLPRWRGAAPVQRAILAGDKFTGVTIMQMDEGLDTGESLYQLPCDISDNDTAGSLYHKIEPLINTSMFTVLQQLAHGSIIRLPQNHINATYASKIKKQDLIIDWKKSAVEIDRLVRAFIPKPIAHTDLYYYAIKGNSLEIIKEPNVKIWQTKPMNLTNVSEYNDLIKNFFENTNYSMNIFPGTILKLNKFNIVVITGKFNFIKYIEDLSIMASHEAISILMIEKIQLAGKKVLDIVDLLNSSKYRELFKLGSRFE